MPRTKQAFQQIRDERKEQILDTAVVVFASKGLASTKISDLAEAAGISQGLLYRYFDDKEDVFAELIQRATKGVVQQAQAALEYPGTPWEKLHWLTEQFLQGMYQKPMYYHLFSQAFGVSGRIHEIIDEIEGLLKALRQMIVEGQATEQVVKGDPDQLVLLYLSCIYGLAAGMGLPHDALVKHFPDAEAVLHILKS